MTSYVVGYLCKYIGTTAGLSIMLGTSFTQCVFVLAWTATQNSYVILFLMIVGFSVSQSFGICEVFGRF